MYGNNYTSTSTNEPRKKLTPKQIALLQEFEEYCKSCDYEVRKEVMLNKLFNTTRKWRADYVLYYLGVALCIVEINGGQWINGRHNRGGKGYESDLQKSNDSQYEGLDYYQYTYEMLERQEYKNHIE